MGGVDTSLGSWSGLVVVDLVVEEVRFMSEGSEILVNLISARQDGLS